MKAFFNNIRFIQIVTYLWILEFQTAQLIQA